jgi:hypothetical protein
LQGAGMSMFVASWTAKNDIGVVPVNAVVGYVGE